MITLPVVEETIRVDVCFLHTYIFSTWQVLSSDGEVV